MHVYSAQLGSNKEALMRERFMSICLLLAATAAPGLAQLSPSAKWATEAAAQYAMNANITYRTASNQQLKMDVYYRRGATTPQPTLVYMHGGYADRTVPYPEAVRLHEALAKVNVPNQLVTVPNGGHGGFSAEERVRVYTAIREFLAKNGVMPKS